ncbi:copine-8 [Pundamilia nyererei]|uniref:Copine-8 n=3 Tax=Haplochromini TaxID=319058 RepID=A0A3B4FC06_9CICH|nr:PREDICTED: copine-8 [Pundamilia nyererei]XP_005915781.1 copine-8 [Haplochromis burtoni]XP_026004096.1 copine-8 isoform X1 [Astatotilapia calliptera]XP_039890960.1 copine-8 isoform X2 [Simochromis diagramma]
MNNSFLSMASIVDFDPLNPSVPATKVEITVSCRNLLDRDTFSKSDPICVLYTQAMGNREWREFGRTEVIDNTLNPDFVRKFILDYFFEERQNLRFDLYDVDSKSANLSKHDFLGQAHCTLGEIVGSLGSRLEKPLGGIPGKKCGTIIVKAEELNNCRESVMMQFCGNKLDKKDFFGKSDPFLVFYRSNEDGTFTICHKTEVVKNTLNPVWQAFKIPVRALCNGDYDRTIKIEVYDWDRDGSHDFIGEFSTSYRELSRGQSQFNVYEVVNPKKKGKKKKYLNSGTVTLLSFLVDTEVTFLDYIKGGTQINFTVAIDFTASNGNPAQPTSLHYMSPYQLNAYAMALKAVGEIIQDYDSDKMFPALGFGAKLPPDGRVSHEFALNGNPQNPYCAGIDGVMEAYYQSLKSVQLYGPTNFSPVINHVARYAASVKDGSQYFVLLIITDGVISDMAQTKESIVNASCLPMSIIIVGVGPAEFDAMVELDGDEVRISSRGRYAERDIVQFVPFRDYIDRTGNHILSMARLAKDVLAEIPDQFLSYMRTRGIKPSPAPPPYTPPGQPIQTQI